MSISVKFFASLREEVGISHAEIKVSDGNTVRQIWAHVTSRQPPVNLLCACNHKYVSFDSKVREGDEVAFFPPVNGG